LWEMVGFLKDKTGNGGNWTIIWMVEKEKGSILRLPPNNG